MKRLIELQWALDCSKTRLPAEYVPKPEFEDKTANGLTKCVIAWLKLNGHQAERISNTGRWIDNSKIVTDYLGRKRKLGTGKYIKGSGTNGTADVSSTISVSMPGIPTKLGLSVKFEIKVGRDRQSEAQKDYQKDIEMASGQYYIVRSFDEFMNIYDKIINNQ